MIYEAIVRPLLFLLDPETAHHIFLSCLGSVSKSRLRFLFQYAGLHYHSSRLQNSLEGIDFPNPIGLAAGFDKSGQAYPALSELGFGFIECGTFTSLPQKGNPRPRLFRIPAREALINRMGFNNPGAQDAAGFFSQQHRALPRGINIGKSKLTPFSQATEDYLDSLKKLAPFADYVTINVSSPNTPGLRQFQKKQELLSLLRPIQKHLKPSAKNKKAHLPLFVKIAPDLNLNELDDILDALVEVDASGIIVSNTSTDHQSISPSQREEGGLSGLPLRQRSTELIRHCYKAGTQLLIIGVGGISSGETALEKILAGASLLQIYTGYAYCGPYLPVKICRYLDRFLEKNACILKDIIGKEDK